MPKLPSSPHAHQLAPIQCSVPLYQPQCDTIGVQVAEAMCAVTAAGDKRVTKIIRQHLQSKDPALAETTIKALSGSLVDLDVHKECYLPTRDELEHDDLEVVYLGGHNGVICSFLCKLLPELSNSLSVMYTRPI